MVNYDVKAIEKIEKDITNNQDFSQVINNLQKFFEVINVIHPSIIMNGPKNPVLTSSTERGNLEIKETQFTPVGTGLINVDFIIPNNKKFNLKAIDFSTATFVGTITEVALFLVIGADTISIQSAATNFLIANYPVGFVLGQGMTIRARYNVTAYTSGNLRAKILYNSINEEQN